MRLTKRCPKKPEKSVSRPGKETDRAVNSTLRPETPPPTTGSRGATGTETGRSDPKGGTAPGRSGQNGCGALLREPRPTARPEAPARYAARAETGQPTTGNDRIAGRTPQTDRQDNRPDDLPKCGCAERRAGRPLPERRPARRYPDAAGTTSPFRPFSVRPSP